VYTICISTQYPCACACACICVARVHVCVRAWVCTRAPISHTYTCGTRQSKKNKPGRIQSQDDGSPTHTRYDVRTSVPPRSKPPPPNPQTHTHTHMPNLQKQAIILTNPSPQTSASPTTLTATPKNWKFSSTKPPLRFRRNFLIRKIFGFSGSRRARSALLLGSQDTSVLLMCC
jgi:hypothetical protein